MMNGIRSSNSVPDPPSSRLKKAERTKVVARKLPPRNVSKSIADVGGQILTLQNEYKYTPITDKQIRLLHLQPATQKNFDIVCSLETVSLNDKDRSFAALSYTWGVGEPRFEIKLQTLGLGSETNLPYKPGSKWGTARRGLGLGLKRFYITYNLDLALRHFRDPYETMILWVDALCINQGDDDEKSMQVKRMADIYSKAEEVNIWLGEDDDDSTSAIEFAHEILDLELLDGLVSQEKTASLWLAFSKLMKRDWFSRRWVVQELAMAQEASLYVGDADPLHWDDFAEAVALFSRESEKVAELFKSSREFRHDPKVLGDIRALGATSIVDTTNNLFRMSERHGRERLTSLESLVSSLLIFEARDPRDTIYALLAIAKDTPQTSDGRSEAGDVSLTADYTKNILEVYKDFIAFCIKSSASLDILCRHWAPNKVRRRPTPKDRLQKDPTTDLKIEIAFPSWISLLTESPFGAPETAVEGGRVAADGLVGPPGRKRYDAARGTSPAVFFGEVAAGGNYAFDPTKDILRQNDIPGWTILTDWTINSYKVTVDETLTDYSDRGNISIVRFISSSAAHTFPNLQCYTPANNVLSTPVPRIPRSATFYKTRRPPRRSDGCLYVKGFRCDEIKSHSDRLRQGMIPLEGLKLGGWSETDESQIDTLPDSLWRTMVADRGPNGGNPPTWYRRAMLYCIANRDKNNDIHTAQLIDRQTSSAMVEFLQRVSSVIWNKRLILCEKERFGLGPTDAKIGDIICVLLGCSVPVVLREHVMGQEKYYQFIGEAYVYGMMDGEALPSDVKDQRGLEEIAEEFQLRGDDLAARRYHERIVGRPRANSDSAIPRRP